MSWTLEVVTPPATPPVSLEEAKLHLRVDHDDEDALITGYVAAATEWAEDFQQRSFVTRTYELVLPRFPSGGRVIRLPKPPAQSVTSIAYLDRDEATVTFDAGGYMLLKAQHGEIHLRAEAWPRTAERGDAVTITYVAGYGDAAAVPEVAKSAILLLTGHLYENRETVVVASGPPFSLPLGAQSLLSLRRAFARDPLGGC